jgi:hypothetical protein
MQRSVAAGMASLKSSRGLSSPQLEEIDGYAVPFFDKR